MQKRKHPKFMRPNYGRTSRSRIKSNWRRQRGIDNKKRAKIAYMGASPSIGYGQPRKIKYMHPSGFREIFVQTPKDLAGITNAVVRIASGVGRKKYEEIVKVATAAGLRVLNKRKDAVKKEKRVKKTAAPAAKPAAAQTTKPTVPATAPAAVPATQTAQAPKTAAPAQAKPTTTAPTTKPAATQTEKTVTAPPQMHPQANQGKKPAGNNLSSSNYQKKK